MRLSNGQTKSRKSINLLDGEPSKTDDLINSLQADLDKVTDERKEERFIWLSALMIVFDIFTFQEMQTWSGPLTIGFIQFVLLVVLGRRWQMDHIWTLTEKIINQWNGKFKN